jgi:DNA topoisomerase-6 subunit B
MAKGTTKNSNYQAISPADFFYRNRDIAGFDNPTRALYTAVRELVENSLDACEDNQILPEIKVSLIQKGENIFKIKIQDNGGGLPKTVILQCFGQVLYGSKYEQKQSRGRFGLGGKMAYLYGQITTHEPLRVITAPIADKKIYDVTLRMDIEQNEPEVIEWKEIKNDKNWNGTTVEFSIEGDWTRSKRTINEYIKLTALITPYANIEFTDPDKNIIIYKRTVKTLPPKTKVCKPHPYGVDIEKLRRIIALTDSRDMISFLKNHFHRVGQKTAEKFLKKVKISKDLDPKLLSTEAIINLVRGMKSFNEFLPPNADCLSPLGKDLLAAGIEKELNPENSEDFFRYVVQRPASSYGGHPFIVEIGIAFGGKVDPAQDNLLYRFANRIPLIYDEYKDVSAKVLKSVPWTRYKIKPGMPVAIFVNIVSTKIPFKTAGKEFIADRIELEKEIRLGMLECARRLMSHLHKKEREKRESQKINKYLQFLPVIVEHVNVLSDRISKEEIEKDRVNYDKFFKNYIIEKFKFKDIKGEDLQEEEED